MFISMVELFLVISFIKHVLSRFNNNKLTLHHSLTSSNTVKILVFKLEFVTFTQLSYRKTTVLNLLFIMFGKSVLQRMKIRGPRTDPCTTPCFILPHRRGIIIMILSIYCP
jgi:hypothetical protein